MTSFLGSNTGLVDFDQKSLAGMLEHNNASWYKLTQGL